MSLPVCKKCGVKKAGRHFPVAGDGTRSDVCKRCSGLLPDKDAKQSGKNGNSTRVKKSEIEPVELNSHFEVAAGLGFRASLEAGSFQLEQDRPGDDDQLYTWTITLAPHEARQLVDWIEAQVKAA